MLSSLYIENVAVIEKTEINFDTGLNVLTGETGAGKSIVIDSIHAALGMRASRDMIRTGAQKAMVVATFDVTEEGVLSRLSELGVECEEGELIISRELTAEGKSRCRMNGVPVNAAALREIGGRLLAIHGQHDNQTLLNPATHMGYLDQMGGYGDLLNRYQEVFGQFVKTHKTLAKLQMDEQEKQRRIDLLAYQIDELEAANLLEGEEEALKEQRLLLQNSERISQGLMQVREMLLGNEEQAGALSQLSEGARRLRELQSVYPAAENLAQSMEEASYLLSDCGEELRSGLEAMDFDGQSLGEVEERLDFLYRLGLKYGEHVSDMLAYLESARAELEGIVQNEQRRDELEQLREQYLTQAEALAGKLMEQRIKNARAFSKRVMEELSFLDMPSVRFSVAHERCALDYNGMDKMEFLISTNAGEEPRPIAKIASGGELSRIMLAMKTVLADKDEIGTLIFDEVDAGISGRAAGKVGIKLREAAQNRQIICVTHLAQIAAYADHHFLIEKQEEDSRTFTRVHTLDTGGRTQELARIIGGAQVTRLTLDSAREMLELAGKRENRA